MVKKSPKEDRMYLGGLLRDHAYDGPAARPKSFKRLDVRLWEIRDLRKGVGYRIYFGLEGDAICIVLHSGDKGSQERDIKLAKKRLVELEE